ncbi:nitrogenase-stabilizing/protective protein NifW [uncultured Cohaesibacter sp.]|uniref:nitrogenase-stabilizing/protective protein NifW n=1 Tax=uncultured Cohaesibacter sp. TaxID=1002546 RepID=UPI00292F1C4F|nr:nitrogenase-stabilizing/protective protein NifW [uncultured Cohaesibacter sp.]
MRNEEIDAELSDLVSAEEFLDYFDIDYEPRVVMVNRLHILQRFHDYLEAKNRHPVEGQSWWDFYTCQLREAYQDFVRSNAQTEKVFKVFKTQAPTFVPLEDLLLS